MFSFILCIIIYSFELILSHTRSAFPILSMNVLMTAFMLPSILFSFIVAISSMSANGTSPWQT